MTNLTFTFGSFPNTLSLTNGKQPLAVGNERYSNFFPPPPRTPPGPPPPYPSYSDDEVVQDDGMYTPLPHIPVQSVQPVIPLPLISDVDEFRVLFEKQFEEVVELSLTMFIQSLLMQKGEKTVTMKKKRQKQKKNKKYNKNKKKKKKATKLEAY